MKKFCFIVLVFLTCSPYGVLSDSKSKKKSTKTTTESAETTEETTSQPAIIAIEIVDPNENSTSSKNSKRTIENSLGYGYNSFGASKPRYEVYKYSQHDIPPYKGSSNHQYQSSSNNQVSIQKSVQYSLPTTTQHVAGYSNILQPGMTLYSTLNGKGNVGSLSTTLPNAPSLVHSNSPVPVVVLRIYPNQLKDSTIHANLPKHHPFAKTINSLDIQSLLLKYIKTLKRPSPLSQYSVNHDSYNHNHGTSNQYSSKQKYSRPNSYSSYQTHSAPIHQTNYQTSNYYNQDSYQNTPNYQTNGGSQNYVYYQQQHQNYPQPSVPSYTKQYQQQYQEYDSGLSVQEAPLKYEINNYKTSDQQRYQSPVTSKPHVETTSPQPQYYYVHQAAQNSYSTESNQYFQPTPNLDYSKETLQSVQQPEEQYYSAGEEPRHIQYYPNQDYQAKDEKLLTYENYPTEAHTRVVFKSQSGNVRTSHQETPAKEVKTIKIHVPANIANVEVQESEHPHYGFAPAESDVQHKTSEQSVDSYQPAQQYENAEAPSGYYLPQDSHSYYSNDGASENTYQNIDYTEMAKYFAKRGTMPQYLFKDSAQSESVKYSSKDTSKDAISLYEDAFPTSTASSQKKAKSKKRTQI